MKLKVEHEGFVLTELSVPSTRAYAMKQGDAFWDSEDASLSVPSTRAYAMKQ